MKETKSVDRSKGTTVWFGGKREDFAGEEKKENQASFIFFYVWTPKTRGLMEWRMSLLGSRWKRGMS